MLQVVFTNMHADAEAAADTDMMSSTKLKLVAGPVDPEEETKIMQILPAHKVRSTGERVRLGDLIVLQRAAGAAGSARDHFYASPPDASDAMPVVGSMSNASRMRLVALTKHYDTARVNPSKHKQVLMVRYRLEQLQIWCACS